MNENYRMKDLTFYSNSHDITVKMRKKCKIKHTNTRGKIKLLFLQHAKVAFPISSRDSKASVTYL